MNNKILYTIIFVLILIIIVGAAFLLIKKLEIGYFSYNPGPLSEQPNGEKFNEYFNKISLGKLPFVAEPDISKLVKTNTFDTTSLLCVSADMKKTVVSDKLSYAIYDKDYQKYRTPKDRSPADLLMGDNLNCKPLEGYRVGEYEYKLYIDDALVAVLPFRVSQ